MRLALFLFLGITLPTYAKTFETQIEQTSPQVGDFGEYRIWLPPSSRPDRILVVVWGSNQCSLGIVDDPAWEELAGSINCALMACFFYPQTPSNHWDHADEGSGAALLEAIRSLALTSGQSQLTSAKLYLVGDSQGGQFAFNFASWQPARTLGFVSLKGGQHDVTAVPNAASVPGLLFAGELDAHFRIANIEEVFSKGRALGAPWCLAIDPRGNHSPDRCGPLVRSFLGALSRLHSGPEGQNIGLSVEADTHLPAGAISSRSWFPEPVFERDWIRFESGVSGSSSLPLGFESKMPPAQGTVSPAFQEVGFIESGEKSRLLSLDVTPNGLSDWDGVSVLDCSYLSDVRVAKVSPTHFTIYFSLSTTDLPLGHFAGIIPLRVNLQGKTVLGGLNVPLTATVVGDVVASPSLILLTSQSNSIKLAHIQISSKTKQQIKFLACEAPPGIKVEASVMPVQPLEVTVIFDTHKERPHDVAAGSFLLHLKTDKEWTLRIPYINSLAN